MFLALEHERALAEAARGYLAKAYSFADRQEKIRGGRAPEDWSELAELGWLGLLVPEAFGGSDCSIGEVCAVLEAFGEALHLEPLLPIAVEAAAVLGACAPSLPRDRLLGQLAAGEARPLVLRTEFRSDDHPAALRDQALAVQGAAEATHFLVPTDGARRLTVLEPGLGVTVAPRPAIDGSGLADVRLTSPAAQADRIDCSPEALARGRDYATLGTCAWLQGVMEKAIEATLAHVAVRRQFGQPLAAFQAVRHRLADMRMAADAARAGLRRAVSPCANARVVSGAYVTALTGGLAVTSSAIQLHGGMGMTDDLIIGHQYRTVLRLQAAFGSAQHHAAALGECWMHAAPARGRT